MSRWHRTMPRVAVLPLGIGAALLLALGGCGDVNANAKRDTQTLTVESAPASPEQAHTTVAKAAEIKNSHSSQKSILQDDDNLLYASPAHVIKTLHKLKSLGVDVVKVSLIWWIIAPDAQSTHHPTFDASDPAAYPPGGWARYDLLAEQTHKLGMKLFLQFVPCKNPVRLGRGQEQCSRPGESTRPDAQPQVVHRVRPRRRRTLRRPLHGRRRATRSPRSRGGATGTSPTGAAG